MKDSEKPLNLTDEISPNISFRDLSKIKQQILAKLDSEEKITPEEQLVASLLIHAD